MNNRAPEIQLKLELVELRNLIRDARCDLDRLSASLADEAREFQRRIAKIEMEIRRLEPGER